MISRDPKCVFVANDAGQAAAVFNWLEHQDISAQVMDTLTHGGLEGLTAWTGVSSRGIEVWVLDPADITRAKELVAEHGAELAAEMAEKASAGPVWAECEVCKVKSEYPGEQRGTVQNCGNCGKYLGVPDFDTDDDQETSADQWHEHDNEASDAASPSSGGLGGLKSLKKPIIIIMLVGLGAYFCIVIAAILARLLR